MNEHRHVERQRQFYDNRVHAHLRAREDDRYSKKLVRELAHRVGIRGDSRVLEIGAGFGRFTFHLLSYCETLVALDLSQTALEALAAERDRRGIEPQRCQPVHADVHALDATELGEQFEFIVGFFILHHLLDYRETIRRLAGMLAPHGGMAFLEPNRRNPCFAAQVVFCRDMTWAEERGMFRLSSRDIEQAYRDAGLVVRRTRRFGFFPPQIINRSALARRIESGIERLAPLEPLLPFVLTVAETPAEDDGQSTWERGR
jgi:2-polyprenyl-3-methyl-5-hydroxy-6-metoxy-1,4-benzoquinol methylase